MPAAKKAVAKRKYTRKAPAKKAVKKAVAPQLPAFYVVRSTNIDCGSSYSNETFHPHPSDAKRSWEESAAINGPYFVADEAAAMTAYNKDVGVDEDEILTVVSIELGTARKFKTELTIAIKPIV